jgi:hypothetical protein
VVFIVFVFIIGVLMHYSIVISKMRENNKEMVQKLGLLDQKIREMDERTRGINQSDEKSGARG